MTTVPATLPESKSANPRAGRRELRKKRSRIWAASAFNRKVHAIHDAIVHAMNLIDELDQAEADLHTDFTAAGVGLTKEDFEDKEDDCGGGIDSCGDIEGDAAGVRWVLDVFTDFLAGHMIDLPEDDVDAPVLVAVEGGVA